MGSIPAPPLAVVGVPASEASDGVTAPDPARAFAGFDVVPGWDPEPDLTGAVRVAGVLVAGVPDVPVDPPAAWPVAGSS